MGPDAGAIRGSGRIGAVALSKKEALALHRVFCSFVARAWTVRRCVMERGLPGARAEGGGD